MVIVGHMSSKSAFGAKNTGQKFLTPKNFWWCRNVCHDSCPGVIFGAGRGGAAPSFSGAGRGGAELKIFGAGAPRGSHFPRGRGGAGRGVHPCKPLSKQTYVACVIGRACCILKWMHYECYQVASWEAKSIGKAIFPAPEARVHSGKFKSPKNHNQYHSLHCRCPQSYNSSKYLWALPVILVLRGRGKHFWLREKNWFLAKEKMLSGRRGSRNDVNVDFNDDTNDDI